MSDNKIEQKHYYARLEKLNQLLTNLQADFMEPGGGTTKLIFLKISCAADHFNVVEEFYSDNEKERLIITGNQNIEFRSDWFIKNYGAPEIRKAIGDIQSEIARKMIDMVISGSVDTKFHASDNYSYQQHEIENNRPAQSAGLEKHSCTRLAPNIFKEKEREYFEEKVYLNFCPPYFILFQNKTIMIIRSIQGEFLAIAENSPITAPHSNNIKYSVLKRRNENWEIPNLLEIEDIRFDEYAAIVPENKSISWLMGYSKIMACWIFSELPIVNIPSS